MMRSAAPRSRLTGLMSRGRCRFTYRGESSDDDIELILKSVDGGASVKSKDNDTSRRNNECNKAN